MISVKVIYKYKYTLVTCIFLWLQEIVKSWAEAGAAGFVLSLPDSVPDVSTYISIFMLWDEMFVIL